MSFSTLLLFSLSIFSTTALAQLNETAQQPGLNFTEQLVLPSYKYQVLDSIPDLCAAYTGPDKECTATMVATNVTYDDCGAPYTVCRCSDAQVSILDAMDTLGKVPIGLRRYFGTIMVMSGPVGAYTFPLSGEAHFFGDCGVNTWIHEATHAADGALGITADDVGGAWAQAVAADTCVPDAYAQNNIVEDFAQVSVLKIYLLLNNNQMPTGFEAACMSNQLAVVNGLTLYDNSTMFGNTCAFDPPAEHNIAPVALSGTTTSATAPLATTTSRFQTSFTSIPTATQIDTAPSSTSSNSAVARQWSLSTNLGMITIFSAVFARI